MKKNRYIPFGYRLDNGEITLHEPEAKAVRLIFMEYLQGHSLNDIADQMTSRGIPYNAASHVWNKHMVKRILDNRKYIGYGDYPALIAQDEYDNVRYSKSSKYLRKAAYTPTTVEAIKNKVFCHECGRQFARLHDRRYTQKWYCRNKNCKTELKITDDILLNGIAEIMNRIIADPDILQATPSSTSTYSPEVARLQNDINRELSKTKPDSERVKTLLLACAAEKYAGCGDDCHSEDIYVIFEEHRLLTEFDIQLFERTADSIQIAKNGAIYLRFKNKQTLTISDIYEEGKKHDCGKNRNSDPAKSRITSGTAE